MQLACRSDTRCDYSRRVRLVRALADHHSTPISHNAPALDCRTPLAPPLARYAWANRWSRVIVRCAHRYCLPVTCPAGSLDSPFAWAQQPASRRNSLAADLTASGRRRRSPARQDDQRQTEGERSRAGGGPKRKNHRPDGRVFGRNSLRAVQRKSDASGELVALRSEPGG